ncbi:MAG: hypothetical protein AB9903_05935 [Vulcanimicrobiota bacterium]
MDIERITGPAAMPAQQAPASQTGEKSVPENIIDEIASSKPFLELQSHHELMKLKGKWKEYKQYYNTDAPPDQIGIKSKREGLHTSKRLLSKTKNSLGSIEKGTVLHGRFISVSSWDQKLQGILNKLGLHTLSNLLDLSTDEIKGGVHYEARIFDNRGTAIASRSGVTDQEGMYKLHVDFSDEEKKKAGNAKKLSFGIFFRGIDDPEKKYAHFNNHRESEVPVGGGAISLISGKDYVTSSDIDKTILDTSVSPAYFYAEPWKRNFLPGTAPLFRALEKSLHTISGSEQNISTSINAAFELHGISPAESDYKDWLKGKDEGGSLGEQKGKLFEQVGFKVINELESDIHLPDSAAVRAHGDITEYDPIVYLLLNGILSGDLNKETLTVMFSRPGEWPELAKVPVKDRETIIGLSDKIGKKKGVDLIAMNCGSGDPKKPQLSNIHGMTLQDFLNFAQRLEDVHPEKNFYKERIIFTDNYLQTALFYRQMGEKAITDGVIKEVGKELVRKGFSPEMLGQSLKEVQQDESGQTPRKFLSRETLASTLPFLKKAGIVPKGFKI